ncbi:hypothetical protein EDB85DRAFT_2158981 [Lactarius pseudohatsudake]|nr:hypothetical protein EDB85DRAFT_2158981 [Lactarius pseudohatsudake]
MQGKSSEMKQGVSESEENSFKEAMQSAFWNGVTLLNGMGSDVGQHQQGIAGPSSPSADAEGFSEVPKSVTLLQPVIGKLIDKDPPKGVSPRWLSIARDRLNLLKAKESEKIERLDDLLCELDDEIVLVDALIGEDRQL